MHELSNGLLWAIFGVIIIMTTFTWFVMFNFMEAYKERVTNREYTFGLVFTTLSVILMSWLVVGLTLDSMIH